MDPITLRAIERLLAVLIGGLSIYLGYHLFLRIPHRTEGEGKIAFPNGISVHLARVGPGIFFALFGAAVVGLSLFRPISYETTVSAGTAGKSSRATIVGDSQYTSQNSLPGEWRTFYSGHGQALPENLDRLQLADDIAFLNRLPLTRREDLDSADRRDLDLRPQQIKLRLMLQSWTPDWGDPQGFRDWVDAGADDPVPPGLEAAARVFRGGLDAQGETES